MASSSAPVHPARYLSVFLFLLIGVYLLVFLTGDKRPNTKLGIDLQGGTRVTLTARTPDGSRPSREALGQAQQIIGARVNGLGVSGSEVVVDGDNLVITVPGNDGSQARNLGQTARLYIRPVLNAMPAQRCRTQTPGPAAGRRTARRSRCPGRAGARPPTGTRLATGTRPARASACWPARAAGAATASLPAGPAADSQPRTGTGPAPRREDRPPTRRRLRRPRRPIRARISPTASPRRRSCGRTPASTFR